MSGTESHDGLLCKISNLHSLRGGGGGQKNSKGKGGEGAYAPRPPKKKPWCLKIKIKIG